MNKKNHAILIKLARILNVLLITLPFFFVWYMYYASRIKTPFYARGNYLVIALFALMYDIFNRVYDGFKVSLHPVPEIIFSQFLALGVSDCFIFIVIWLLSQDFPNIVPGFIACGIQIVFSVLWTLVSHFLYFRLFRARPTAIVYDKKKNIESLIDRHNLNKVYDVRFSKQIGDCLNDLSVLDNIDVVFLSGVHSHERNILLKHCVANGIDVFVIPCLGDVIMSGAKRLHMFHLPMLHVERYMPSIEYLIVKRAMDIVLSLVALIAVSPLMLFTALAVKLDDGGHIFYKQVRLTKNGRKFNILKFRSMREDAEKDGVARLSTGAKDDRVTRVGKVIRACRVDELPQLINILKGDLSICGPRPERPEIAEKYCEKIPEFALRLQAKAGLTGYAQVYGQYNTTPYDKLQMDLMYIANPSIIEDIKIIFATVKILFSAESTEGVSDRQTTAEDEYE